MRRIFLIVPMLAACAVVALLLGASGTAPALSANLVDAAAKAKQQTATVDVTVTGVEIIDPAAANDQPRSGQGHLPYQLDDGPVNATTCVIAVAAEPC